MLTDSACTCFVRCFRQRYAGSVYDLPGKDYNFHQEDLIDENREDAYMKRLLLILLLIPTIALGEGLAPEKVNYTAYGNPVANILLFGYNTIIGEMEVFASNESGFIGYEKAADDGYVLHDFMIRGVPGRQGLFGITLSGNPASPEDIQRDTELLLNTGYSLSAAQEASGKAERTAGEGSVQNGTVYWDLSEDDYKFDFFFLDYDDGHTYLSVRLFDSDGVETLYLLNDKHKLVSKLQEIVEKRVTAEAAGQTPASEVVFLPDTEKYDAAADKPAQTAGESAITALPESIQTADESAEPVSPESVQITAEPLKPSVEQTVITVPEQIQIIVEPAAAIVPDPVQTAVEPTAGSAPEQVQIISESGTAVQPETVQISVQPAVSAAPEQTRTESDATAESTAETADLPGNITVTLPRSNVTALVPKELPGQTTGITVSDADPDQTAAAVPAADLTTPVISAEPDTVVVISAETPAQTTAPTVSVLNTNDAVAEPEEASVQTGAVPENPSDTIRYIRIKKTACGIRSEPDQTSKKIGVAPARKKYRLLSVAENGWYEIDLEDGRIGYVSPKRAYLIK